MGGRIELAYSEFNHFLLGIAHKLRYAIIEQGIVVQLKNKCSFPTKRVIKKGKGILDSLDVENMCKNASIEGPVLAVAPIVAIVEYIQFTLKIRL